MIPPVDGSPLSLERLSIAAFEKRPIEQADADTLVYVTAGLGAIEAGEVVHTLEPQMAALVLAGERHVLLGMNDGVDVVVVTVGVEVDLHAPMGAREHVVKLASADAQQATGARSFQVLFGPHNGSTRATLFAGYVPPGKAPWHYHLYDEIVWVPDGPGRLHLDESTEELGAGAAFRLRPRQVHIVENLGETEMTIIGVFTPAGSPSAAFLQPGIAAEYSFAG